jgi:hypothetical protein
MAIMDSKLEFCDAMVISCASGSAQISTNVFDMNTCKNAWGTAITNDIGAGNNGLVANVQVATVFEASARVVCKLLTSATSGLVSSGSVIGTAEIIAAAAAVGTKRSIKVPPGTIQRWVGMQFSVSGSSMDTGAVDAWIGLDTETPST